MGKPATLLEGLCGHTLSFGGEAIEVERRNGGEWVYALKGGERIKIANYQSPAPMRENCSGTSPMPPPRSPFAQFLAERLYILKVHENFAEEAFEVSINPAAEARSVSCTVIHRKTGPVSGLHLLLHERSIASRLGGDGPGTILPGLRALDSQYDQDPGAQRTDRKDPWSGPIHSPPCAPGALAAIGVALLPRRFVKNVKNINRTPS